jgi:hypothetical protein
VALSLFVAQHVAAFGFLSLDYDLNRVARLEFGLTGVVENLFEGDKALGLHTNVDNDVLVRELDYGSGHYTAVVKGLRCGFCCLFAIE